MTLVLVHICSVKIFHINSSVSLFCSRQLSILGMGLQSDGIDYFAVTKGSIEYNI